MFRNDQEIFQFVKRELYVPAVCDMLDSLGFRQQAMHHRLRPLLPDIEKCGFVGRARTIRWMETDYIVEDDPYGLEIEAMDSLKPGDVVVHSTDYGGTNAPWGELTNETGQAATNYVRRFGVDTSHIIKQGERIGIYFLEIGANQRPSKVIYDRAHSAMSEVKPGTIPWKQIFSGANWFHFTGITPAISNSAAEVCLEAVSIAREKGLTISCDLNYRAKLWR